MIVTLFSAISGMRFVHSLVMGLLALLFGAVSAGVLGYAGIDSLYEWLYIILVLMRKYVFQKESIINFRQGQKTAQISKELSKIVSELLPKHAYEKLKTQNFENRL
jgi:cytochrome b subunit of formate dehydrogenase